MRIFTYRKKFDFMCQYLEILKVLSPDLKNKKYINKIKFRAATLPQWMKMSRTNRLISEVQFRSYPKGGLLVIL